MYRMTNRREVRRFRKMRFWRRRLTDVSRPRLCIFRSSRHIQAQVIDDVKAHTLVAASTVEKELIKSVSNIDGAKQVGQLVAKRAQAKGIKSVVFDRGGYLYHGKIKALADAAREAGLQF